MLYADTQAPYNPQQYNQSVPNIGAQFAKPLESLQPATFTRASEPEKPKAPIPEQHMHLKTVFDELKNQCYENAKNPVRRTNLPLVLYKRRMCSCVTLQEYIEECYRTSGTIGQVVILRAKII